MKEQDVWRLGSELWEKREKFSGCFYDIDINCIGRTITIRYEAGNEFKTRVFTTEAEVHRFLDGLEE